MAPVSNNKDLGSGASPFLSIVIPTFNRPTQLSATVAAILPQLTPECELLILDNASTPSASEAIAEVMKLEGGRQCRIVRNVCNIGAYANVLRCFEYAAGTWVWVLSDDDLPLADAVETALRHAREYSDAVFINFWSDGHHNVRGEVCVTASRKEGFPRVLNGLDALIDGCDCFNQLGLISSSLYRRDIVPDAIGKAYIFAGTFAPHFSLLFIYLRRNGGVSVLSPDALVVWGGRSHSSDNWDVRSVMTRAPEVVNIFPLLETRQKFGLLINPFLGPAYPIRGLLLLALLGDNEHYARQIDDQVLAIRYRCLMRGRIELGAWFRLGLLFIISRLCPILEWGGRISGFRNRHPGVPDRDVVTRLLDDHRT